MDSAAKSEDPYFIAFCVLGAVVLVLLIAMYVNLDTRYACINFLYFYQALCYRVKILNNNFLLQVCHVRVKSEEQ